MKCLCYTDGRISRVNNELAFSLVKEGKANFIQKSEWKKVRGTYVQQPQEKPLPSKQHANKKKRVETAKKTKKD